MAHAIFSDPPRAGRLLTGLDADQLRDLARAREVPNQWGVAVYHSKVSSRSARRTFLVERPTAEHESLLRQVRQHLAGQELVCLDRQIGAGTGESFTFRYYVTRPYAHLAYMMFRNLFAPRRPVEHPDIVVVQVPEWPEICILVHPSEDGRMYTWVMGSDYYGEGKMGGLRAAMHILREFRGGLGLHAGSKLYHLRDNGRLRSVGVLIFGLSGTGKTTITVNDHGLKAPEGITILQDDINFLMPGTRCYGTEESFYIKTDSLSSQPELYRAVQRPEVICENVWVNPDGTIDFDNQTISTNGRAIVPRRAIPHTADTIDMDRVDVILFNTRRYDLPPIGRLTSPAQMAAVLMLGESTITSADDPTRVGESLRVVAFDPFILTEPHRQGNVFYQLIKDRPIQAFVVNTGKIGGMEEGIKITPEVTLRCIEAALRGKVEWRFDPDLGYERAVQVEGVDLRPYDPDRVYGRERFAQLMRALREERRQWLSRFPGLYPEIRQAIEP